MEMEMEMEMEVLEDASAGIAYSDTMFGSYFDVVAIFGTRRNCVCYHRKLRYVGRFSVAVLLSSRALVRGATLWLERRLSLLSSRPPVRQ
ncbi:hypothetical protein L1049_008482 [Liquidambar formosana]|uniref:Uncharacterized protein n=1 Tax=Liquidambar formosana TaxID=63359 RepID=A0AAP0S9Q7_LIQFO